MKKEKVIRLSKEIFKNIALDYGLSKHQPTFPYLEIEDSPYSDADDPDLLGEYKSWDNEMVVYWKNITSREMLVRTLIHEYQHYLQSPTWMTRYWSMGFDYRTHPYEIQAYKEEENWEKYS